MGGQQLTALQRRTRPQEYHSEPSGDTVPQEAAWANKHDGAESLHRRATAHNGRIVTAASNQSSKYRLIERRENHPMARVCTRQRWPESAAISRRDSTFGDRDAWWPARKTPGWRADSSTATTSRGVAGTPNSRLVNRKTASVCTTIPCGRPTADGPPVTAAVCPPSSGSIENHGRRRHRPWLANTPHDQAWGNAHCECVTARMPHRLHSPRAPSQPSHARAAAHRNPTTPRLTGHHPKRPPRLPNYEPTDDG